MSIHGFIPVHKPIGMTSQQAVSMIKKLSGCKKVGHTGTLDPAAEGLLLIALGKATRLAEYFLSGDKGYQADIFFGKATDTGDREGKVIETLDDFQINPDRISKALEKFLGRIEQIPPAASALKINGQRAYTLFRQGLNPEMPVRQVEIKSIRPLSLAAISPANPVLKVDVICSKGTYIRSLAIDIGSALDCPAHLSALIRTSLSQISLDQAATLADLERGIAPWLMDMSAAVNNLPHVQVDSNEAAAFCHGRELNISGSDGEIAVFTEHRLLGIARAVDGIIKPVKVIQE